MAPPSQPSAACPLLRTPSMLPGAGAHCRQHKTLALTQQRSGRASFVWPPCLASSAERPPHHEGTFMAEYRSTVNKQAVLSSCSIKAKRTLAIAIVSKHMNYRGIMTRTFIKILLFTEKLRRGTNCDIKEHSRNSS